MFVSNLMQIYVNLKISLVKIKKNMYHTACKVESQSFDRSYSQLTFLNFL